MLQPVTQPLERTHAPSEERSLELLRFLILGSRGGENRARILALLLSRPHHAYELALALRLNYGTVTLHLRRLAAARLIVPLTPGRYAQAFAVAPVVRNHLHAFQALMESLEESPRTAPPS